MAKQSKKRQSNETRTMIIALMLIFISVIGMFNFGIVGAYLTYSLQYLVGHLFFVIYIGMFIYGGYLFQTKKHPKKTGPRALGVYFITLGLLLWQSYLGLKSVRGLEAIYFFLDKALFKETVVNGGLLGALVYAPFSFLFGEQGTIIALIVLIIGGLSLVISKSYIDITKQFMKKPLENRRIKKESKFYDIEQPVKQNKRSFKIFADHAFDENGELIETQEEMIPVKETKKRKPKETRIEEPIKAVQTDFSLEPRIHQLELPEVIEEQTIVEEVPEPNTKEYRLPPLLLLKDIRGPKQGNSNHAKARENATALLRVLEQFGVKAEISDIHIGPSVTKYEVKPEVGVRVNKIASLQDDIKMALAAKDIRIEAPIPGKAAVGIEIPNIESMMVTLKEVLKEAPPVSEDNGLLVGLGRDIAGKPINIKLNTMPHLLVAGATGSGKSVCINGIIVSILMRFKPDEVKLLLVDPKKVELAGYNGIPHLLAPVVTDPKKAAMALKKVVVEMERRYEQFAEVGVRNLAGYNEWVVKQHEQGKMTQFNVLPFIVAIVDELADLMMVASKDVEDAIMRITQMARAAGIHLIVATQRPSTDVITGIIKANIPSRIAFAVSSGIDSRTILDSVGAERLLGKGDMLFSPIGQNHPTRIQGAFISDEEVSRVVDYVVKQQASQFDESFMSLESNDNQAGITSDDPLYEEVRSFVLESQKASTSLLQRRFQIGYNRAARLIDQLEANEIIGPQMGSKQREVYLKSYEEE